MKLRYSLAVAVLACAGTYSHQGQAQAGVKRLALDKVEFYCGFVHSDVMKEVELGATDIYTFDSNAEAEQAVQRILAPLGLAFNFTIRAATVPNAAAMIQQGTRYVLYNAGFMQQVKQTTKNDWAALSIMAHELGHHLQGHTATGGGSRPEIELEADHWSGFILRKLNATLPDAQAAMNALASTQGSASHPGKAARLAAIAAGWEKAAPTTAPTAPTAPTASPGPSPSSPPNPQPDPPTPQFDTRCVFPGELQFTYWVTRTNDIYGVEGQSPDAGPMRLVAKRTRPVTPSCARMYTGISIPAQYCVMPNGAVVNATPMGYLTIGQCGVVQ